MTTFLVTGGAGFIGSHLIDQLLLNGHKVIVIDNLSTGKRENLPSQVEFIFGDINDRDLVTDVMHRVDACYHLAALLGMVSCKEDWLGTHKINLTGTITLLNAARDVKDDTGKIIPVVYASSCAVYGDFPNEPLSEDIFTIPLSAYGADKLSCELHAHVATWVHGIPTFGLRIFNAYGPRQNPDSVDASVIPIFIERVKANKSVNIFGNGEQTRDFVYVSDVVKYLQFAMSNMHLAPMVFNVSKGKVVTINQLVEMLSDCMGRTIEINYQPKRAGDVFYSCGSPAKANKYGLKAEVALREGLQKTVDWWLKSK